MTVLHLPQVRQLVAQHYPAVEVIGTNYPVEPIKQAAASMVSTIRNLGLVTAIAGDTLFGWMGIPVPGWYTRTVLPNRFGWIMGKSMSNTRSGGEAVAAKLQALFHTWPRWRD